jgi:hypothetical protein
LTLDGEEIAVPIRFALSSGELRIAKAVKRSVLSVCHTKLKVGQALEVGEPEGNIFEPKADRQKIMLLLYLEVDNTGTRSLKRINKRT